MSADPKIAVRVFKHMEHLIAAQAIVAVVGCARALPREIAEIVRSREAIEFAIRQEPPLARAVLKNRS